MKKALLAGLAVIVGALIVVPSASASTNACTAPDRCTAATSEDHVDLAAVRVGKFTRGVWKLTCTKGSHSSEQKGFVGLGGKRLIQPDLNNASCTLVARGRTADGPFARVRVALS